MLYGSFPHRVGNLRYLDYGLDIHLLPQRDAIRTFAAGMLRTVGQGVLRLANAAVGKTV